jgi:hypothetical protein
MGASEVNNSPKWLDGRFMVLPDEICNRGAWSCLWFDTERNRMPQGGDLERLDEIMAPLDLEPAASTARPLAAQLWRTL